MGLALINVGFLETFVLTEALNIMFKARRHCFVILFVVYLRLTENEEDRRT